MKTKLGGIRIVIADSQEYFREGLKSIICRHAKEDIQIVGEAENGKELLSIVEDVNPDVIITDTELPIITSEQATKLINEKETPSSVLAVSNSPEPQTIYRMLESGAKGYVLKKSSKDEMIKAVKAVYKGESYYCNHTTQSLYNFIGTTRFNKNQPALSVQFSDRELDFMKLLCKELTTKEIADIMHVSARSVEDYCKKVKEKTATKSMVGIALYAVMNSIIPASDLFMGGNISL